MILGIILFVGFILRIAFVSRAWMIPFNYLSDASQYFVWARSIVAGKEFVKVYHQAPLYPFFLSFIFILFGSSIKAALFIQALLGVISCYLVYHITIRLFRNRWIGLLSAFLMAIYAPAIFYNGMLLMATLVSFLYLVFIVVLLKALEENKFWIWGVAGITLGLSALARGTILLFIPFLILYLIGIVWKAGMIEKDKRERMNLIMQKGAYPSIAFLLGVFIMILPVTLRNYIKGKDLVLINANAGITFYEGNNPWATGMYMDPPGLDLGEDFNGAKIAGYLEKRPLRPSEVSRFWFDESWRYIQENPLNFLKLIGKKLAYFWNQYEIPNAENIYFAEKYSRIFHIPLLSFLFAGPLGVLGIIMAFGRKVSRVFILLLFLLSHMVSIVLFFIAARYRLPITPLLIIFMSYAIYTIKEEIKDKRYVMLGIYCGIGLLLFILVAYPWKGLNKKRDYAAGFDNIGILFHLKGNYRKAIQYYTMALDHDPGFIKAYNNMGGAYLALNKKEDALKCWYRGLEHDPDFPLIHINLGKIFASEGKKKEAEKAYRIAADDTPYSIQMRHIMKGFSAADTKEKI